MDWSVAVEALVAVGLLGQGLRLVRLRREVMREYPDRSAEGAAAPREHPWQWGEPPEGTQLRVHSDAQRSRLVVPANRTGFEIIGSLFGYAVLAGAAALFVAWLINRPASGTGGLIAMLVMTGVMTWVGWLLLHADSKLLWITLEPDRAVLTRRIGIGLLRHIRVSPARARRLEIASKVQSGLAMTHGQTMPQGYLTLTTFWGRHKLVLDVNPSALTWVQGGLESWRRHVADPGPKQAA